MGNFDKYFTQTQGSPAATSSGLSKYFTGTSSPVSAATVANVPPITQQAPIADLVPHINSADVNRQNPLAVAGSMIANIPHEAATAVSNIASVPGAIYDTVTDPNVTAHPLAAAGGFAKGVYDATLGPVVSGIGTLGDTLAGGVFKGIQNLSGIKLSNPAQQKAWDEKYSNAYNAVDGLTKFMIDHPVASASITGNTVKSAVNTARPNAAPITDGISATAKPVTAATTYIAKPLIDARNNSINASRVTDLNNIISGYAKGRTFLDNAKPEEIQALDNIANRTNLEGTVSTDGRLNLTQVMKDYQANTVDKYSSTVRDTLIREGKSVPVEAVKMQLIKAMDDARVAGNQKAAWESSIEKLTKNLEKEADPQGNIPLFKVHDAKIGESKTANYAKRQGNSNVELKRKAIAHSLKTSIEDNSAENIQVLNHQLEQYYTDLSVLDLLNGKLVSGGKLGKYFAQVSGNIIGAGIGSAVGGPIGMAFGSALGGEAAATMKGRQMKATFGRSTNNVIPPNPILEKAKTANSTPATMNKKP